jgi:hypothetical protein
LNTAFSYITANSTGDNYLQADLEMGYKIGGIGNIYFKGNANIVFSEIDDIYRFGKFVILNHGVRI